ncbi:MAG TPA: hypothetical protein VGO47_13410 [Chlamydiales bacterium]|nr:hypothetical protein [Chlamydiales bacterium]
MSDPTPAHVAPIRERLYGETSSLAEPVDPELLLIKNRDIPPWTGMELKQQLLALDTVDGVDQDIIWRILDACDCGRWFTKQALHEKHRFVCPYWHGIEPAYTKHQDQTPLEVLKVPTSTVNVDLPLIPTTASMSSSIPYSIGPHPSPVTPPTASPATRVGAHSLLTLSALKHPWVKI